jgi:hypothetical protein
MISQKLIDEENKKLRQLQLLVDLTIQEISASSTLGLIEGFIILNKVRQFSTKLFPEKEKVFNLIYKPRILRVLKEKKFLKYSLN